jgi:peptidoglycan/LPS O-acetylase OafA/YrhL
MHTPLLIALYLVAIAFFCLATRRLPILSAEAQHRVSALDGLRGILATAVVVHHFTVYYVWRTTAEWQTTDSRLINNMGAVPVSLFFMITGYLFARKVYRSDPVWTAVLVSRLRRILPMYLFSVALIVAISFWQTRGTVAPLGDTLRGMGHWVIFISAPINGFTDTQRINAGVQWTLLYEAVFYLCLPVLYCLLRRRVAVKPLVIGLLLLACLWPEYHHHFSNRFARLFIAGIVVAVLEDWLKRRAFEYGNWRWTLLALALLVVGLTCKSYSKVQMVVLAVPFALFVLGNSLHGLLENRGMKILGEASFSIYLLHGIVIYLLFSVFSLFDFSTGSFVHYAWLLPIVVVLVSSLSVATYWGIERPFLLKKSRNSASTQII